MYTRNNLLEIFEKGEQNLTKLQKMGKNSCFSRNLPYYGELARKFSYHLVRFKGLHNRLRSSKLLTDFPRTLDGFIDFICYMGPVPLNMKKPTVGRKNHNIGYVKDNFEWQESLDNSTEIGKRIGFKQEYRGYTHTIFLKKRKILENFVKENKGIFPLKEILSKTGRTDPRKLIIFLKTCPNCKLVVKNLDGYVEIN